MRIDRNGTWYYHGSPIGRKELVRLFATVLRRDEDGEYWLVTPVERARIQVEDVPFLAVELDTHGDGRGQVLTVRTNMDEWVVIDARHPVRVVVNPVTSEPTPYVRIRDGIEARVARPVYYEMVDLGTEERTGKEKTGTDHIFGIWSSGEFFPLGSLDDDPCSGA